MSKGYLPMFIKKVYALVLRCIRIFFGNNAAKAFDVRIRFHKKLNLRTPKTLSDKVSWLSVNEYGSLETACTDKIEVREYIREKGLDRILIPLVGGPWDTVEAVCVEDLPSSFILKATHGCKMVYPVPDKTKLDVADCREKMQSWLNTTYGTYSVELHYENIPHRIYAEKLLEDGDAVIDYKFHCLNGEPKFVLVCSNRCMDDNNHMMVTLDLFDMQWKPIFEIVPYGAGVPGNGDIPKPALFDDMIKIARTLSKDFKFVRVDLYESEGAVLFGELTFTPACGAFSRFSDRFLSEMGSKLSI